MSTHPETTASRPANRFQRAYGRISHPLRRLAVRGQLGPLQETQLARLTGARR